MTLKKKLEERGQKIKPKDLTCRMCVYSSKISDRDDLVSCNRRKNADTHYTDYWCGEGAWVIEDEYGNRRSYIRESLFIVKVYGELLDPWSENA